MATKDSEKSFDESLEERIELVRQSLEQNPEKVEKLLEFVKEVYSGYQEQGLPGAIVLHNFDNMLKELGLE